MRKKRVAWWVGSFACLISAAYGTGCSTERAPSVHENVGVQRQPFHVPGHQGVARKVCQIVGPIDFETGLLTKTRSLYGTDLGYPVPQGDRIWFLFGDQGTFANETNGPGALDPIASTSALLPRDECPKLEFKNDPSTPESEYFDTAAKLDGDFLGGDARVLSVPTGALFDVEGPYVDSPPALKNRFIAHFTINRGDPTSFAENVPRIATASVDRPTEYASLAGALFDADHFLFDSPAIVHESEVSGIPLPPAEADPTTGSPSRGRVFLLWGSGHPDRNSPVFLGAVRLEHLGLASKWRFLGEGGTWTARPDDARPVFAPEPRDIQPDGTPKFLGCVGELSVTFNEVWKTWMMVYTCGDKFPQARFSEGGAVILRTAPSPLGPWSPPRTLYQPAFDNHPPGGDVGYGNFIHRGNPRGWREPGKTTLQPICVPSPFGAQCPEPAAPPWDPFPTTSTCASSFPSYCTGRLVQDEHDATVGCCLRDDRCCDFALDPYQLGASDGSAWGGGIYGAYPVQPWSRALPTDGQKRKQRLYFVLSTWNPYTVVLMSADITETDFDNDGVDDDEDHCPNSFDPAQANCNANAERARQAQGENVKILNDACDPVPCPTANANRPVRTDTRDGNCDGDPYDPNICFGRVIKDRIDMAPVGSSPLEELRFSAQVRTNIPVRATTHARFCQADDIAGYDCLNELRLGDRELEFDTALVPPFRPDPLHVWHQVTLTGGPCTGNSTNSCVGVITPVRGQPFDLDYGIEVTSRTWRYAADDQFWVGKLPIGNDVNCINAGLYGQGTCLGGSFWLHGDSKIGSDDQNQVAGDGTTIVGVHGQQLSNHYFPATPDATFARPYGGLRSRPFYFEILFRPDPPPPPVWRFQAGLAVPFIRDGGHVFGVLEDGSHELADEIFDPALANVLFDSAYAWSSAIEASAYAGNASRPIAIALSSDATRALAEATVSEGSYALHSVHEPLPSAAKPPPRTGFVTSYSRARGWLFMLGGKDASGVARSDAWLYALDDETWYPIAIPPGALGEVVATVYSFRDGHLWVLDRTPGASKGELRILRIEPETGAFEVVAEGPPGAGPRYDFHGLLLDQGGHVVLFASSEAAQKHRFARLAPKPGGVDAWISMRRDRALSARPFADHQGFALYFEPDRPPTDRSKDPDDDPEPGNKAIAATHLSTLPVAPGSLAKVRTLLR